MPVQLPWWAAWLIPMIVKWGAEAILHKWPKLPDAVREILERLAGEQKAANEIPDEYRRGLARRTARKTAVKELKKVCSGIGCPSDLKS